MSARSRGASRSGCPSRRRQPVRELRSPRVAVLTPAPCVMSGLPAYPWPAPSRSALRSPRIRRRRRFSQARMEVVFPARVRLSVWATAARGRGVSTPTFGRLLWKPGDRTMLRRQERYLGAIASSPRTTIHKATFAAWRVRRPLGRSRGRRTHLCHSWYTKEKGSDVSLASFMLVDGFNGLYDVAIVVSVDPTFSTRCASSVASLVSRSASCASMRIAPACSAPRPTSCAPSGAGTSRRPTCPT